jgi:hypothetical protein
MDYLLPVIFLAIPIGLFCFMLLYAESSDPKWPFFILAAVGIAISSFYAGCLIYQISG